jgi:chromosome partitioning protein
MRTILVANPKGGSGKTTLSINLAGYLADSALRCSIWIGRNRQHNGWHPAMRGCRKSSC